jgi:hypothetical protein
MLAEVLLNEMLNACIKTLFRYYHCMVTSNDNYEPTSRGII